MSRKTKSEVLFERFCSSRHLRFEKIPEGSQSQPDYWLFIDTSSVLVEVKQFDPNDDEKQADRALLEPDLTHDGLLTRPGKRMQDKIGEANEQFKNRFGPNAPTLLVVYNNILSINHANTYFIKVAMFGLETFHYHVPTDTRRAPHVVDHTFGRDGKTKPDRCRHVSAVATLTEDPRGVDESYRLQVFHNPFAVVPLDPAVLRRIEGIRQFALPDPGTRAFQDWIELMD